MNKIKVIMDSGKEYIIETPYSVQDFVNSFYNKIETPFGASNHVMKSSFMFLDEDNKIMFSPIHVSSIEIIE